MPNCKKFLFSAVSVLFFMTAVNITSFCQSKKFSLQFTLPSNITVCHNYDSVVFEIRNIHTFGVINVYNTIKLPTGCKYISGSLKSNAVSEFNISNLNSPVFKLKDFTLAGYLKFSIKISSDCNLQSFVSKGNQALINSDFTYTGGSESHVSGNINVKSANILINSISNQVKNAYIKDIFIREILIKNTGNGSSKDFLFFRVSGSGVSIKSSRMKDKYSYDSIISKIDSNDFLKVGNNDKYFDIGEEIKIYDTVRVLKCSNLSSVYYIKFGCQNTICNSTSKNAVINIDAFTQGLFIKPTSVINWCFDLSKPSKNNLLIINKSNKQISNTIINIYQTWNGGFYNSQMSAIDTSTLAISKGKWGKQLSKNYLSFDYNKNSSYFTCLGSTPIGGISLKIGDLAVGDTIYINWSCFSCFPDICNTTITANRWMYSATYSDLCGNNYQIKETWGSYGGAQYFTALPWIPTDIVAGTPEKLNYTITSSSLINLSSKSQFAVKLNIPNGLTHNLKTDDFKFSDLDGVEWKPYKLIFDSKDYWAYFNNPPIDILKSELNIIVSTDCKNGSSGLKNINLNILYKIDSTCNSKYFQLYCNTSQTKVHCKLNCSNGGMLFKGFKVVRKNYGLPDNDNNGVADTSGTLNMQKVKSHISILFDTISAKYSGIVFSSGSTNVFFNGKLKTTIANGNLVTPISTNLRIYRNGKLRYSCDKLSMTSSLSGTNRNCDLDFTSNAAKTAGCANFSNYFFLNGDSVVISLNFVYSTNIGNYSGDLKFTNTDFFLSTTPNPSPSQKLQCDTLNGSHILLSNYYIDYYTENYTTNTCDGVALNQNFYFSAGNCCNNYVGGNQFSFEYRKFTYLHKIGVILPTGYLYKDASFTYYYTTGTSKYKTKTFSGLKPFKISQDTIFFNIDTFLNPQKGIYYQSDEGWIATMQIKLLPTCNSAINTLEPVTYLSYYRWITNNQNVIYKYYNDFVKFEHPKILLTPINSNSISNKDTFTWDVVVTNELSGNTVNNLWISNTDKNKAEIIAVKDLSNGTFLSKQADIFKIGNLSSANTRNIRIYAKSKDCKTDSIKVAFGWNCNTYPDSFDVYNCKNLLKYVTLTLNPLPPLIISKLIDDTSSTDVCTNRFYEAVIANTDEENIYNLKLKVTIPQGTTFVDSGMYYSFPYGNKFYKLSKPTILSGNTYIWNLSDSIASLKQGLAKVSDTLKNKIKIRFYLETNCNIIAGSVVSIIPEGTMGCGEPVRKIGFTGNPIKIKGAQNSYFTSVKLSYDSINLCKPEVNFKAKVIYLGPVNTKNGDSIILSLPKGFYPDTTSLVTKNIKGRGDLKNINNQVNWLWSIPTGTLPGDSSELIFKIKINGNNISCGQEQFSLMSFTKKKAYCQKNNDSCFIKSATGTFAKNYILKKSNPVVTLLRASSTNAGDSGEMANIAFTVKNSLNEIDTTISSTFYLVADRNMNGKFDISDFVISKYTISNGFLPSQLLNFNFNGFIKNTDACNLIIVSDPSNCQCFSNAISIFSLKLNNAGRDTTFCSNYNVILGLDSVKNFKYEWMPSTYLKYPYKSKTVYSKFNISNTEENKNYILKTAKPGSCYSYDTIKLISNPVIILPKLKDTINLCSGKTVNIGDTAKGGKGTLSFNWSPPSGLSSTNKMIVSAGTLLPTKYYLTINDQNNCKIKDSIYLKIVYAPNVKIAYEGNCEKKEIKFKDVSDYRGSGKGNVIWKINFNNIYQPDPTFIYDTLGYYFTRLVAENQYGCIDSGYKYVKIFGNPVVSSTKQNLCFGDSLKLTDKSIVAQMNIKAVNWLFSTDTATGKSVSKSFNSGGKHYFYQQVISDSGCISTYFDSVFITQKPKAQFSKTYKCLYDSIIFNSLPIIYDNDSIINYKWNIENNVFTQSNLKLKFDTSGIYKISLSIKTKNNCSDSISNNVVINPAPVAIFTTKDYCPYDTVIISENSTIKTGNISNYKWILDGKTIDSGKVYFNSKIAVGLHKLKLMITSDSLCNDSSEKNFSIYPSLIPKASFGIACENDSIKCADLTSQSSTSITFRNWIYNKTNYLDSTFKMKVTSNGIHPIVLKLTSKENCIFSKDTFFTVNEKPIPDFQYFSKCNDNTLVFSDKSIAGTNSKIISRKWFSENYLINFIDSSIVNKFNNAGSTNIKLVVQNSFQCIDSIAKNIDIPKENFADFIANDACPNDTVKITFSGYTGNNKINFHRVNWGDGVNSSFLPLAHSYNNTGKFLIKYQIETLPGCKFDTSKFVTIHPVPQASFTYYPPFPDIINSQVTIKDNSSGAVNWYYTISDGAKINSQNAVYNFIDSGKYNIVQFASNEFGCIDTAIRQVFVNYILLTYIPNSFSPGNDNINPEFFPTGLGIKEYKMTIFNRWGEIVFENDWGKNHWDGTYKGEFVPTGIYHYFIQIRDYGNKRHDYSGILNVIK
ncbi:MAG: gliding motility-associated C-terminal domain-containing protein [Bacteroidetes bacterium]|nr:gliding motility-associated C-terminal domain-containing protein [Bacteroidota bacterium]